MALWGWLGCSVQRLRVASVSTLPGFEFAVLQQELVTTVVMDLMLEAGHEPELSVVEEPAQADASEKLRHPSWGLLPQAEASLARFSNTALAMIAMCDVDTESRNELSYPSMR